MTSGVLKILFAILIVLALAQHAQAQGVTGAMVAQSYERHVRQSADKSKQDIETPVAITMGYILAVIDTDKLICPSSQASIAQHMEIVHKYLQRNKELMDRTAALGVSLALRDAYPCAGRRP